MAVLLASGKAILPITRPTIFNIKAAEIHRAPVFERTNTTLARKENPITFIHI
jgi:hypothetical protein